MTSRRGFLQLFAGATAALLLGCSRAGEGGSTLRVALFLDSAASDSARMGAQLGGAEAARTAALVQRRFELVTPGTADDREVRQLIRHGGLSAVVTGREDPSRFVLLEIAQEYEIPLIVTSERGVPSSEPCLPARFYVSPSLEMRLDALAQHCASQPELRRWYVVAPPTKEGGAIYGDALRALHRAGGVIENPRGMPAGALVEDDLNAIRRTRPAVVVVGLSGEARQRFLTRFGELGLRSQLASPFAPPPGGIGVACWHPALTRFGAAQLNERFRAQFGQPMDGDAWIHWMAVKLIADAMLRGRPAEPVPTAARLVRTRFDGHKGVPLSFRGWDHQLRQPLYILRAAPQTDKTTVAAEMPDATRQVEGSYLDQLHPPLDASAVCGSAGEVRSARGVS